jgi:hypothetical protein
LPRKFSKQDADKIQIIQINGRRYPSIIKPGFYKATEHGSDMSRFVLVEDPTGPTVPFYVQEFEITIAEWKLFLESEEAKPLFGLNEEERKAFERTTGQLPTDYQVKSGRSRLRTYGIIASIRSHLAETSPNDFVLDKFEVRLAENLDELRDGFPMPLISKDAALAYAHWVSPNAALPTAEQLKVLKSLHGQPGIPGPVTSLDDFVQRQVELLECRGGKVFAFEGNLAELDDSMEAHHGKRPWYGYGGDWGEEFPNPSKPTTVHYTTGARLIVFPNK